MALINAHLTRQFDLIPEKVLSEKINIIGAGAIGSFVCLALAKMGFTKIEVWDADTVSIENMNSQFYRFSDIDKPKVIALRELVEDFTKVKIKTNPFHYEEGALDGIVISAVDSMAVRKEIWKNHFQKNPHTKMVFDPRMGAEQALIYAVNPLDRKADEWYQKTLYSDDDAVEERCTAKATIYTVNLVSGYVVKLIKDFLVKGECLKQIAWSIKDDDLETFKKPLPKKKTGKEAYPPNYATSGTSIDFGPITSTTNGPPF